MLGMPLFHVLLLVAAIVVLLTATQSRRLHPFLVLVFVTAAFGLAAGLTISLVGRAFGSGFSEKSYSPGLVIVGAGFVAGIAESTGASAYIAEATGHWRSRRSVALASLVGLIAGLCALPAAAFAILTPVLRPIGGGEAQKTESTTLASALSISASHGLVLFAPVPVAAASILGADWGSVALFGIPVAILVAALGAAWARWMPAMGTTSSPASKDTRSITETRSGWAASVLIVAVATPLVLLMVQSLGDIPSEPFGGGAARELILGVGRPLVLFVASLAIAFVGLRRRSFKLLADATWTARILGDVAGVVLIVCAAGGLQRLCQETGMAELFGERLLDWRIGGTAGLLVPFLIAAVIKTLQGSSLVAAIAAAGIVQMSLVPLGLASANGRALATLAIGAGAMTVSHLNDEYYWLVADRAGLSPLGGLGKFTLGTLVQGIVAIAALITLSAVVSR